MTKKKELTEQEKAIIDLAAKLSSMGKYLAAVDLEKLTLPVQMVASVRAIEAHQKVITSAISDLTKPANDLVTQIKGKLLAHLIDTKQDAVKTEEGTCYKSEIMSPSIEDREKYLDFVLENWDDCGNELLQLGAPKVEAVRNYMQMHEGRLPPGVKTTSMVRVNIRKA